MLPVSVQAMSQQYDLPPQTLLQQSSARAVSGEELETYGKHAASLYGRGECPTLNSAVVETIKSAGLAPEQVRRVVEFTNTAAFLSEFKKEGTANKYVSFDGGPASFNDIIQDLNDGGGGTVFDRGTLDYSHVPGVKTASAGGMQKTASAISRADELLAEAFSVGTTAPPLPFANPMADVFELKDKLASARDAHTSEISELEVDLMCVTEELYHHVKQAALQGGESLGTVVNAWDAALSPDPELVKAAFAIIGPRLVSDAVFTWDTLGSSLEKVAGAHQVVNQEHPTIAAFSAYADIVTKLAHVRASRDAILDGVEQLDTFERSVSKHYAEVIR